MWSDLGSSPVLSNQIKSWKDGENAVEESTKRENIKLRWNFPELCLLQFAGESTEESKLLNVYLRNFPIKLNLRGSMDLLRESRLPASPRLN